MKLGTANPARHWHRFIPLNNDVAVDHHRTCGAVRRWNGRKWVVKKQKQPTPPPPAIGRLRLVRAKSCTGCRALYDEQGYGLRCNFGHGFACTRAGVPLAPCPKPFTVTALVDAHNAIDEAGGAE